MRIIGYNYDKHRKGVEKMIFQETEKTELKRVLNESFEKEVDAFLNSFDGVIYIGVEDNGTVVGVDNIDKTMKEIADIITTKILPNPQEYVKVEVLFEDGKTIIAVNVKKGNSLYYIKKYGRSAAGCYIRVGTTCRSMTEEQIEKEYIKTLNIQKPTISEKESFRQDLTFNEFKSILMIKDRKSVV